MPSRSPEDQIAHLAEHFRAWGVRDPESWASSQVEEGIDQYARLVFLKGAWQSVIRAGDTRFIDPLVERAERKPDGPGAGAGHALRRLLAAGASREDLAELVRVMQWQTLAALAYQLSDPGVVDYPAGAPPVEWALFRVDEDGRPTNEIGALHEDVLSTEPEGNEMRPVKPRP